MNEHLKNYHVLAGYILVEPINETIKLAGGLVAPETAKANMKQQKGLVVKVGKDTEREKMEVAVGDTVIFSKGMGAQFDIERKPYSLMRQRDILCYIRA
jgi:chaperonin GroES